LNKGIFYQSEEEFKKNGRWKNYSPGREDHNLLLSHEIDLSFIEENESFCESMEALCGSDWQIFKKAIIRSVPEKIMPEWVKKQIESVGRPNVNPFVIDSYKDIQYFLATDFHQDKTRPESDFVTVYIYLDNVEASDSALQILLGSHELGMSCYPHNLRRDVSDKHLWYYSNEKLNGSYRDQVVVGPAGSIVCFHCLTLHGTGLNNSHDPRISLRYLIKKGKEGTKTKGDNCLLTQSNNLIKGPFSVNPNRTDVSEDGSFLKTGSTLLSYTESAVE
jgi:hypothetical protein